MSDTHKQIPGKLLTKETREKLSKIAKERNRKISPKNQVKMQEARN
jgi:hypothetical protein